MLTYPDIDPIAFSVGPAKVHWYGLMYLVGFVGAWALCRLRARQPWSVVSAEQVDDMIFYLALGVILGGRIGSTLFYYPTQFLANPLMIFKIWEGGMSFHGGMLGVFFAAWLYARKHKLHFIQLTDFFAPAVPLGLGAGRIGNFINGELWGKVSDVPWAMVFPNAGPLPRHPSMLYEAVLEGLVLLVILWLAAVRPQRTGFVSGLFMISYGLFRFLIEFVRNPDVQIGYLAFGWLTMGQVLSFPMILVGVYLLYWSRSQPMATVKEES
jgi:phosphatidylglycerol---prolipoprotein diacylglyceryl transferase